MRRGARAAEPMRTIPLTCRFRPRFTDFLFALVVALYLFKSHYDQATMTVVWEAAGTAPSALATVRSYTELEPPPTPPPAFSSTCDLPEFAPSAPRLNLTIIVFAWRRLASLQRLIGSLQAAHYCGHTLPLRIMVDGDAAQEVLDYVRTLRWASGSKTVIEQETVMGIRGMWINSASAEIGDDEHVLPLEDDIEVSPLFYWWLLRASSAYGSLDDAQHVRRSRLVGISLYTPRLNEIVYPQVRWSPDRISGSNMFLLQVPCSWGALYIGSMWRDFLRFYRARARPPFFNFTQEATQRGQGKNRELLGDPAFRLPSSRSNVWPRSWKRFMIDYMYGRAYLMLYPNLK